MAKPVRDMIGERPPKEISDPPIDKPLEETQGGSPPYPFPPELIKELAGKSEEEVSSLLSKFRTGLSEHRTHLSEYRTALSDERSHLSNERTHLSYLRTGISLISLGVTINRFAVFLVQSNRLQDDNHSLFMRMRHTEQMGLGMVIAGVLLLTWSLYRYRITHAQIEGKSFKPPVTSLTVLTAATILLGGLTCIILMAG